MSIDCKDIAEKIFQSLNNNQDSMVLLSGGWGVGKTHFINNEFKEYLLEKEYKYISISVFGISDMKGFKSRLFSKIYLSSSEPLSIMHKITQGMGKSKIKSLETASFIVESIIPLIDAWVKTENYEIIMVVDDIERVLDEKLRNEIISECYNMVLENKIKIVIAANKKEISSNRNVFEKGFGQIIEFNRSPDSIIEISFQNKISTFQKDFLKKYIELNEFNNIRILKRIAQVYDELKILVREKIGIGKFTSEHNQLLIMITLIIDMIYACALSRDEILLTLDAIKNRDKKIELLPWMHPTDMKRILFLSEQLEERQLIKEPLVPLILYCDGKSISIDAVKISFILISSNISSYLDIRYWGNDIDFKKIDDEIDSLVGVAFNLNNLDFKIMINGLIALIKLKDLDLYKEANLIEEIERLSQHIGDKKFEVDEQHLEAITLEDSYYYDYLEVFKKNAIKTSKENIEENNLLTMLLKSPIDAAKKITSIDLNKENPIENDEFFNAIKDCFDKWDKPKAWKEAYSLIFNIAPYKLKNKYEELLKCLEGAIASQDINESSRYKIAMMKIALHTFKNDFNNIKKQWDKA